jgi:hypothetical protein
MCSEAGPHLLDPNYVELHCALSVPHRHRTSIGSVTLHKAAIQHKGGHMNSAREVLGHWCLHSERGFRQMDDGSECKVHRDRDRCRSPRVLSFPKGEEKVQALNPWADY